MKKVILLTIASLFLIFSSLLLVGSVNANFIPTPLPTIDIQANGNIEPSTVPIQRNGNIYTLTGNIVGYSIKVQCDDIVLDGAGFILQGQSYQSDRAIIMETNTSVARHNVVIKNFIIQQYSEGISSSTNASNCLITLNTIKCVNGIDLLAYCSNNQVTYNTLLGTIKYPYRVGSGILIIGDSNLIKQNFIAEFNLGIGFYDGTNSEISENQISCDTGMTLLNSSCNSVSKNNLTVTKQGISFVSNSSLNKVFSNNILGQSTAQGILLTQSNNNSIYQNNIENTMLGIYLTNSTNMLGKANATFNIFFQNNFNNNTQMISVPSNLLNYWDNNSIGNYWSDFLNKYPNAKEIGTSGIYDRPYAINESNTDNFPLVSPVSIDLLQPSLITPAPMPTLIPTSSPMTPTTSPSSSTSPNSTSEASPIINPSPTTPELSWMALPILLILITVGALVFKRQLRKGHK